MWAERWDGKMDDIFALQDKITTKIVAALAVQLTESDKVRVARKYTDNVLAYDTFIKGRKHALQYSTENLVKAISYYKEAIELDPNYGQAYAGLADVLYRGVYTIWKTMGYTSPLELRAKAHEYLKLAMKNPTALAHKNKSRIYLNFRLFDEALAEAENAIALDPNDPTMHSYMAYFLIYAGNPKEALNYAKKVMRFDPLYIGGSLYRMGIAHFCMENYDESISFLERTVIHLPELMHAYTFLMASYAHLGRDEEARKTFARYMENAPFSKAPGLFHIMRNRPFRDQNIADRFAQGLIKAGWPGLNKYYKINSENILTGEESREILFGKKIAGFNLYSKKEWWEDITKDGKVTHQEGSLSFSGVYTIEKNLLGKKYQKRVKGLKFYQTVFRNPKGTPKRKNEYFMLGDTFLLPFSIVN
ncbi:hypothetical protein ACFLZM_02370 [Thermodesulfobacteriota bacterium]